MNYLLKQHRSVVFQNKTYDQNVTVVYLATSKTPADAKAWMQIYAHGVSDMNNNSDSETIDMEVFSSAPSVENNDTEGRENTGEGLISMQKYSGGELTYKDISFIIPKFSYETGHGYPTLAGAVGTYLRSLDGSENHYVTKSVTIFIGGFEI